MAIKPEYLELESIPQPLRDYYVKSEDGVYILNVEGIASVGELERQRAAMSQELARHTEALSKANAKLEEFQEASIEPAIIEDPEGLAVSAALRAMDEAVSDGSTDGQYQRTNKETGEKELETTRTAFQQKERELINLRLEAELEAYRSELSEQAFKDFRKILLNNFDWPEGELPTHRESGETIEAVLCRFDPALAGYSSGGGAVGSSWSVGSSPAAVVSTLRGQVASGKLTITQANLEAKAAGTAAFEQWVTQPFV